MLVLGADDELTAESRRVGMVICCLASRVEQRSTVRKGLASTRSAHDARFEVVDHGPESIDLASLDDFQGPQATERRVGGVEPSWDGLVLDQPGESLSQADELLDAATRWFVDWLSAFPVGDRSLGETREPGEHLPVQAESSADRVHGEGQRRLQGSRRDWECFWRDLDLVYCHGTTSGTARD